MQGKGQDCERDKVGGPHHLLETGFGGREFAMVFLKHDMSILEHCTLPVFLILECQQILLSMFSSFDQIGF